ncbi:hypothetical protein Terro_1157 [Terriglobus roseus DSM 18391]|uniref:TonB-dependent transporter Oar-like beta-barrel domain-containing protein n=1 Tax=Terriglobus roseus (strain DSM 18391 / NRRL B-41598 / KBS 63) TaxID=926566 RepID=I3ZE04_TERRK|nr:carboxypeptidase regulatory-like domain-containing protein [Terriglobus roseus]AFL87472.1 hypothetical protein Terro_1157 [Terriglobus roseus DSM 18391]
MIVFRKSSSSSACTLNPRLYRGLLALSAAVVLSTSLSAQVNQGGVTGHVVDPSHAMLPAATVIATNTETHAVRRSRTNHDGLYDLSSLAPGVYTLEVEAPGFGKSTGSVTVQAGAVITQDFSLAVGKDVVEIAVVAGGALEPQSESHELKLTVDEVELSELPTNGRNPLSVALLAPGSESPSDATVNTSSGQSFGTTANQLHLGGGMDSQTGYLQDGVQNVTLFTQSANLLPSVEAIRQMTVIVNGADARYANPSTVNILTKGGTNRVHGSLFDFLQNDALNAQNYSLTGASQVKTPVRYNLFGGSVGGPVLHNRLFFFGSYQGLRQRTTAYTTTRVPTNLERAGDFSEGKVAIYDPLTYVGGTNKSFTTTTGKNAIPTARITPFATTLMKYIPLSNLPLDGVLNINYQAPIRSTIDSDQFVGRIDWNMTSRDQLYVAGGYSKTPTVTPSFMSSLYGALNDQSAVNGFLEHTHVFSPRAVNTFRAGYNRSVLLSSVLGAGSRPYFQEFGLKNLAPLPSQWTPPTVSITSFFTAGNRYAPQGATQNRFQYADELNYQIGRHHIFLGGEFLRTQVDGNWTIQNNGYYTFNATLTGQYVGGTRRASGSGWADVLLGYPSSAAGATGVSVGAFREWQVAGYAQDDWKVTPRLTLNVGLRYDFDNPPNDRKGRASIYDLPTNQIADGTWNTNYRDFSPRIGFAYSPQTNTVIHGGFGIYYAGTPYNYLQFLLAHAPNFITQSLSFTPATAKVVTDVFVANPSATGITPQTLGKTMKDVSVQQFNLGVEHTFLRRYMLSVTYAGQVGRHSSVRVNANQPNAKSGTSAVFNVRPYTYAGDVFAQYNIGYSNSNALQTKFIARLPGGSRIISSYTYGRSLNISDGDRNTIQNAYDAGQYYAPAAWDRPHHLNVGALLHLPVGRGQHFLGSVPRPVDWIAGGWQLNSIYRYATGLPVTITATNTADTSSIGTFLAQKVCDPTQGFQQSRAQWFNTACFVQPGNGAYGRGGRGSVRQPNLNQVDLGLEKSFGITESARMQLRLESFNALNHPQLSLPGQIAVNSASLGALNGTAKAMRTSQVALRFTF